ncbi:MAG: hypothetical protein D6784_03660 [Chloroflexi bacterium]|nr:MAG: hypothetical protein D6784_03660 [Chloroflexota bacterium]
MVAITQPVRKNNLFGLTSNLTSQQDLEQWLHEGITAAKTGQLERARFLLLDVVEQDQTNEVAWYWLYRVFDRTEDKRICLENLLTINPQNRWASQELQRLLRSARLRQQVDRQVSQARPAGHPADSLVRALPATLTLHLVTAFWFGISLVILAGGLLAAQEWLSAWLRSRSFPVYITPDLVLGLLAALMFILLGILGLVVAVLLYFRATAGFYGSIILGLLLLLIGPTLSLVVEPPNYLTTVCTGGISGMIVLLTLAAQSTRNANGNYDSTRR